MSAKDILDDITKLEHRVLVQAIDSQMRLFEVMNGNVSYGELRSFDIARFHGVTAEQFAALPSRAERMKWINERNAKIYGRKLDSKFFKE